MIQNGPYMVILQHDDGGREVLWDGYMPPDNSIKTDVLREFKRGFVCAVIYRKGRSALNDPAWVAFSTWTPDDSFDKGYSVNAGEHWARPVLEQNQTVITDINGVRRIAHRDELEAAGVTLARYISTKSHAEAETRRHLLEDVRRLNEALTTLKLSRDAYKAAFESVGRMASQERKRAAEAYSTMVEKWDQDLARYERRQQAAIAALESDPT